MGTHDDDKLLHMEQTGLVPEKKEKTVINYNLEIKLTALQS